MRSRIFYFLFFSLGLFFSSQAQELHAHWTQEIKKVSDCEYDLIFKVKIDPLWHMYSQVKEKKPDGPNPTKIVFKKSADYEMVGTTKESKPVEEDDKVFEMKVHYFVGNATFTTRIKLLTDKKITVKGTYEYQICTEEACTFPPAEKFEFELPAGTAACVATASIPLAVTNTTTTVSATDTAKKIDSGAVAVVKDTAKKTTNTEVVASTNTTNEATGECNAWEKFLLGLAAGFGAMLMPCIYSLIPLTVSFFLKRSKTKAQGIKNSLLYGFFIVVCFVVPTMLITIAVGPDALSKIATNTWLNIFFFLLFVVFALSFFGLFEITLPASWANKLDAKADRGGVIGIFFMALVLVVVSFSCTAGFLGTLLTALAEGGSYLCPLCGFTGFGLGIALPFMLFAFFPSFLKSLPKAGGWMNTFKVTVAFIELALAVKFLANADNVNELGIINREVFISLWIAIFGMLSLYLLGVFRTSHDDAPGPLGIGRIMWATFFMAFTFYLIPGLWGAPLKLISSFPPPHYLSESPEGVGYHGGGTAVISTGSNPELAELEKLMVSGPEGLRVFKNDYDNALKYAKLVKKPLFVDFTGNACVNCRYMESNVWVTKEVFPMLQNNVVIVSLYVDNKTELPVSEQKEVMWYGKNRTLGSVGDKFAYFQSTKYGSSSQPQYVLLNHDESNATNGTIGTEKDEIKFAAWLKAGIDKFNAGKK